MEQSNVATKNVPAKYGMLRESVTGLYPDPHASGPLIHFLFILDQF
jgi:hypothetical protein